MWIHDLVHVVCGEDGHPAQLHGVMIDVTVGKQAQQAAELLARAGTLLAEPGTVLDKLARITRLTLGPLADSASISLVAPDGTLQQVIVAHADPETERALHRLPSRRLADALADQLESGRPCTVEVTDELLRASGLDEADAAVVRRAGLRRGLTLPLVLDGRVLGLLGLGGTAARSWDGADLVLAEELGRRIAVMLAANRLAQRSRQLQALTTALAAAESVADVTAALLAGVRSAFEATAMSVYRRDVDGRLVLVDAVGYPPELLELYEVIAPDAQVPLADCARTGELVWLRDLVDRHQRYASLIGLSSWTGNRAAAAVPIRVGQQVVGAIGLSFAASGIFWLTKVSSRWPWPPRPVRRSIGRRRPTNGDTSPRPCNAACYRRAWRRFPACSWPRDTGRTGSMSRLAATFMTRSPRLAAGRAWLATSVGRDRRQPRLPRCAATRSGRLR